MFILDWCILGLATHRLTAIWAGDAVLRPIREFLLRTPLQPLVGCPFCMSVWIAGGLWSSWYWGGAWGMLIPGALALSNLAILYDTLFQKLTRS